MVRITRIPLLWLLLSSGPSWCGAPAQDAGAEIPMREKTFIASKVYASLQMYFAHWRAIPDVDLDAAYRPYLAEVLASDSRLSFDLATMKFLAVFRNGHTIFVDSWLEQGPGKPLPFRLLFVDGKWVVKTSRLPDLPPGTIIDRLDATDVETFFHEKQVYIPASNEREARSNLCFRPFLFPLRFSLTTAGGARVEVDRTQAAADPPADPAKKSRPSSSGRWQEEPATAYVKIPSFGAAEYQDTAIEFLKQFSAAKTLIIDVRGNEGGSTPSRLIGALMDRPYAGWHEMTNLHIPLERIRGLPEKQISWSSPMTKPSSPLFGGRLVIVADRDCASAC